MYFFVVYYYITHKMFSYYSLGLIKMLIYTYFLFTIRNSIDVYGSKQKLHDLITK